jgi:hypothetical protein
MKTFFSVLGALLVAGAIFIGVYVCFDRVNTWQKRKSETLAVMDRINRTMSSVSDTARDSGSLTVLSEALTIESRLQTQYKEAEVALQLVLQTKPFVSLTSDEQKMLAEVEKDLNPHPTPTAVPAR